MPIFEILDSCGGGGLPTSICPVCQRAHTSAPADQNEDTIAKWTLCPDHYQLFKDGYIALIGVAPSGKEETNEDGLAIASLASVDDDRTGEVLHISEEVFDQVFNSKVAKPDDGICICEQEVIDRLKVFYARQHGEEPIQCDEYIRQANQKGESDVTGE